MAAREQSLLNVQDNLAGLTVNIEKNILWQLNYLEEKLVNVNSDLGVSDDPAPTTITSNGITYATGAQPNRKTIYLGLLLDYSGPYGPLAPSLEMGIRLFWQYINENKGGINNQYNVIIKPGNDTQYNPVKHKEEYEKIKNDIIALACTLGTTQTIGIYPDMVNDNIVGSPMSWTDIWDRPQYNNILSFGSSYFIDAINGVDYIMKNSPNKDNISKAFLAGFKGDYGSSFVKGCVKSLTENGIQQVSKYVQSPVVFDTPTMIQQCIASGAELICLATGPNFVLPLISALLQSGILQTKTILLASPSWNDLLLQTPIRDDILSSDIYIPSPTSDISFNTHGKLNLLSALNNAQIDSKSLSYSYGFTSQFSLYSLLTRGVTEKDITRSNLTKLAPKLSIDYDDIINKKLYNGLTLSSIILKPDGNTGTSVKVLDNYLSNTSLSYGTLSKTKVGILYNAPKGDFGYNDLAFAGIQRAQNEFGSKYILLEEISNTGNTPEEQISNSFANITSLSQNNDIILAVGFSLANPINGLYDPDTGQLLAPPVSLNYPELNYGLIDASVFVPNARGLLFAEEEGSFLVGVIAALKTTTNKVGFLGGVSGLGGLIEKFEAGFVAGVKAVNQDIQVEVKYISAVPDSTGFFNQVRAKELSLQMYNNGADIIYHAAGGSGTGMFEAAKEFSDATDSKVWGIGVDSDQYNTVQSELQDYVLSSMIKKVDVVTYLTLKEQVLGTFTYGDLRHNLSNDSVGYSTSGGFIDDIVPKVDEYKLKIINGEIVVPTEPTE